MYYVHLALAAVKSVVKPHAASVPEGVRIAEALIARAACYPAMGAENVHAQIVCPNVIVVVTITAMIATVPVVVNDETLFFHLVFV